MPTPQPGDPAQDASTIAYAIEDARRVAPGAPVELLLFTDPALDGVRLRGVDPSIRVRHDSAPVTPAATPVGNPRRTRVPVIPLVVGALALGLAVGGVGMWLTGRGQNPAPVDGDRSTYDVNVTLSESDGRLTGQVAYPQLSCSGEWVETTRTSAMIILTETIAVGTERCVRTVTINMLPGDDEVLTWFSSPAGQTISSHMRRA